MWVELQIHFRIIKSLPEYLVSNNLDPIEQFSSIRIIFILKEFDLPASNKK